MTLQDEWPRRMASWGAVGKRTRFQTVLLSTFCGDGLIVSAFDTVTQAPEDGGLSSGAVSLKNANRAGLW